MRPTSDELIAQFKNIGYEEKGADFVLKELSQ